MSSPQQNDAGNKFWQTPELIEILLPFLDFESTLKLAQSHALTLNILQIDSNWKKLFRRFHARKADEKWQYDTRFKLEIEEPLLSALSTILSKQERVETHYTFSSVKIQTVKSALAFKTIMHIHPGFTLGIKVCGDIGTGGWEVLAEVVLAQTRSCWEISTSKSLLNKASRETLDSLRRFWVALGWNSLWCVSSGGLTHTVLRANADNGWKRLLEVSNMSLEEWVASFEESDDSEEEEEDEEEEEEEEDAWMDAIIDSIYDFGF